MEGSQACSASDFSIGQFKSLVPLLLAHGRECHRRNSYMVAYSFFKNFLFSMPLWLYGFYTWWSGQTFFDMYLLTFFNVFFTFMPVVLFAIFDWEMKLEDLVQKPKMYKDGKENHELTIWRWTKWQIEAMFIGAVTFALCFSIAETDYTQLGKTSSMWLEGCLCYSAIVIIVTWKILSESNTINPIIVFFDLGSVVLYFILFWLESQFK